MKKKLLFFVMTFFIVCLLTVCVSAVEVDGIYYSFTPTDTYETYNGYATVTEENKTSGAKANVVIPECVEYDTNNDGIKEKYVVTTIAANAFGCVAADNDETKANQVITSVFISKTVQQIGNHAFRGCRALKTVVIEAKGYNPETEETCELQFTNAEFYRCYGLVSVDMSNSNVVQVGNDCFTYCSALTTVYFSSNIKRILSPFTGCTALTTINSLATLESIGRGFYGTKLSGNIVCSNLESLSEHSFRETKITSIDFSGSTFTSVPGYAFRSCPNLSSVVLPETVTSIGTNSFIYCSSLTSINLPRGITSFGAEAFRGSPITGDLIFDEINTFSNHALRETQITSLVILGGDITSLGTDASLYGCTKLEILVLPETVVHSGNNTFTNCNSLKYIVASKDWTSVTSKPSKADLIIRGTEEDALNLANAWSGWTVAPFSEFDPTTAGTKTIYYGAVNANDSVTTFVEFDGFDKSFSAWDATTNTETTYAPIFEAQGYSTNPEKTSIATGFTITKSSLDAYKTLFGGEVNFGIVIFNPKYLGTDSLFNAEGNFNANDGYLMVDIGTEYSTCSLSVQGFNELNSGIELVFAGFAYADDITKADFFQKEYVGTEQSPVSSPMVSKVTRKEGVLYTTTIASVCTHVQITTGKESLGEYTIA